TLSCKLAGGDELYRALVAETGLVSGETDAEGTFSLQNVECLGSCGTGPVLQINDTYHERVTRTRLGELFAEMRAGREPAPTRERGGDNVSAEKAERVAAAAATAAAPGDPAPEPAPEEGGVA
ncbi:MAG TPA: NAD(P)H-dependent oxidoreductase subunit E, partial [Thermoleophilia bacterium]|nr:NAD(P)H-dependent oxidoreductase subunit E [Thermoleophilia bacterium]